MEVYQVEITESLQRTINITANNEEEAIGIIKARYKSEDIVLGSADYIGVSFDVIERSLG